MKQLLLTAAMIGALAAPAMADDGYLTKPRHHKNVTSSVPDNGDQNPYAIFVAPASAGKIKKDDVLVDNFNNAKNLQGTGSTIMIYHPDTEETTLFADIPHDLKGCPGGVGLSTAMAVLKSGHVIVGSTPSTDGTTATKGAGCLIVLDSNGQVVSTIAGKNINDPWGNMAVIDHGDSATLFVSNTGFGVGAPAAPDPVVNKATILRIELSTAGKTPVVKSQTMIASGLSEQAAKDVFIIGPTGLALSADHKTLYASDAINNRVVAIDNPTTLTGPGNLREVTKEGFLHRPLAMVMAPNGNLLVTNGKNGQVVEINPASGKQIAAQWLNADKAQVPPGSGNLFGIAMKPTGDGFYYVEDDTNNLSVSE